MAATLTYEQEIIANQRGKQIKVIFGADSATADVPTGLSLVKNAYFAPFNGCAQPTFKFNSTVAGVATAGTIGISSATSAGSGILVVYGLS
jgi:hypothetical protein